MKAVCYFPLVGCSSRALQTAINQLIEDSQTNLNVMETFIKTDIYYCSELLDPSCNIQREYLAQGTRNSHTIFITIKMLEERSDLQRITCVVAGRYFVSLQEFRAPQNVLGDS